MHDADTHIHAPQFPNAGIFGKKTLLDWLKTYTYPMEASLGDVQKAKRVYEACVSTTLAHGTTTATYYATIHVESTKLLADVALNKGERALVGRVCMDHPSTVLDYYRDEDVETSKKNNRAVMHHIRSLDRTGSRVVPVITPRSAVSCTSEHLLMLRDMANDPAYPLRIQSHIAENVSEMDLVRLLWPTYESYTAVYDEHGLLTSRTILAHGIYLSEAEKRRIAAQDAKVSHCPVSNAALGSGMCRVRELLDSGITVGLGSDVSGGYSPSILEAARQACLVSRLVAAGIENDRKTGESSTPRQADMAAQVPEWDRVKLTVEESLWMATRGGAEVVGWEQTLGSFEVGMAFDVQLIAFDQLDADGWSDTNIGNVKAFGWESWEDVVAKWVYCGDDRNTIKVWVDGDLVHARS